MPKEDNIICHGAQRAIYFNGLPEMPINNVVMKNSLFMAETGADINYAKDITFENVHISVTKGEILTKSSAEVKIK